MKKMSKSARLARFISKQRERVDTEDLLVREWFGASREMGMFIPITFPYLTLRGFMEEAGRAAEESKKGGSATMDDMKKQRTLG